MELQPFTQHTFPAGTGLVGNMLARHVADCGKDFEPAESEFLKPKMGNQPNRLAGNTPASGQGADPIAEVREFMDWVDEVHAGAAEKLSGVQILNDEAVVFSFVPVALPGSDEFPAVSDGIGWRAPRHPGRKLVNRLSDRLEKKRDISLPIWADAYAAIGEFCLQMKPAFVSFTRFQRATSHANQAFRPRPSSALQ